jgi:hypothetical protein
MKLKSWLIAGTVAGLTVLGGVQANEHPAHAAARYGVAEASAGALIQHRHGDSDRGAHAVQSGRLLRMRPPGSGPAASGGIGRRRLHAYIASRAVRWLFHPHLLPWWMRR